MRRRLVTACAALLGAALAGACSSGPDGSELELRESCEEYTRVLSEWSVAYGAEMGAVGQATAAGDRGRQETAVPVVRQLFGTTAEQLREQAGRTADRDLAGALTEAADGLAEIAEQIETYQDVTEAPTRMSSGRFAAGGGRVSAICSG